MLDFNDVHEWTEGQKLQKYNFKDNVKIEMYDQKTKKKALNIIRNNDFLQYHYFSQQYDVVKGASYLYLFYIKYNGVKMYVGFASISQPTLNKTLRKRYFGKNFLPSLFMESSKLSKDLLYKTYVLSRIVLLPSYRGLGIARYLLENIVRDMRNKSYYFEMLSNMFHNYYFAGYEFNTIFIDMKKHLTFEEYQIYFEGKKYDEYDNAPKGFKGNSKYIANMVFDFKKDAVMSEMLGRKFGVDFDWTNKQEMTREKILWATENEMPLILLEYFDFDFVKKNRDNIIKSENEYFKNNNVKNEGQPEW